MSKTRYYLMRIIISSGVGIVTYLLFQLLLALLIVKGILGEGRLITFQMITGGVSALLSSCLAMSLTKWAPASAVTGIFMVAITILLGVGIYDGIVLNAETLLRIIALLIGGLVPSVLLRKKGRRCTGSAVRKRVRRT